MWRQFGVSDYPRHNTTGQRQHTNPRSRLKRWEAPESEGLIWCYEKQPGPERRVHRQTIASATVLRHIWTEDEERRLNCEVEQPATSPLHQLTETLQPSLRRRERQTIAKYVMSLFRRGWQELAAQPQRLRPEVVRLKDGIHAAGFSPDILHALQEEVDDLAKHPPGRPLPIQRLSDVLAAMRWTVIRYPDPVFINGDSPVQIVPDGIICPDSEVTLPLSPTRALIFDWGFPRPSVTIQTATAAQIFEVNRRTARKAKHYIYFASRPEENTVLELLNDQAKRQVLGKKGPRRVPRKHRRKMQNEARRILRGDKRRNVELIMQLKMAEADSGLFDRDNDRTL